MTARVLMYATAACPFCQSAHEVVSNLRDRFGDPATVELYEFVDASLRK